jgi:hypothetical protein
MNPDNDFRLSLLAMACRLLLLSGLVVSSAVSVQAQVLRTAILSLENLGPEDHVVLEQVLPTGGHQVVIPNGRGIGIYQLAPNGTSFRKVGDWTTGDKTGLVGFVRLEPGGARTPVLANGDGLWRLEADGPPVPLLSRATSIPPGPEVRIGVVGLDFNGDGVDEVVLPDGNGYTVLSSVAARRPSAFRLPGKLQSPRLMLETDDGPVNPMLPPMRRVDMGRYQGVDTVALIPAQGGQGPALVLSSVTEMGARVRHEVFPIRVGGEPADRPSQIISLATDPMTEDLPVRMGDGRIRIVRTRGNLDLLQPRTDVTLHDESGILGRWTSRDPIGLGAVVPLADGESPSLVMATLALQAGSVPDMAGMVSGKPLSYRLQFFPPAPDGRSWIQEPVMGPELGIVVDPSLPRLDLPFVIRDLNGDGLGDIVARVSPSRIQIFLAQNTGFFGSSPRFTVDVAPDATLDFVDVDGNRIDDVVLTSRSRLELRLISLVDEGGRSLLRRLNPRRILNRQQSSPPVTEPR